MKKIMMTKFGFDRWPEEDFSDDGNRFICYRVGSKVRVTKCVSDGWAYIDGGIRTYDLPYEVYGNLPHYQAVGKLNGIKLDTLTEDMLTQLFFDCVEYEKEYDAALAAMVWPTELEIKRQCEKIQYKAKLELIDIEQAISGKVVRLAQTLADWEWKIIKEYIGQLVARVKNFDPDVLPKKMVGKATSIEFCRPNNSNLADSYYYTHIMELINK
jgi:hypothetical protein